MSATPNYTLEVISHHPKFESKALKKYYVDGIETVGAWGDEPFEIRFKNNTWQKVQVKLTLDGTDILSGEKATTEVSKDMWVVQGYGTLSLKAWPETNNGGAAFIFTSAEKSVAVHTHGDLSHRGIIGAAVFTEGHVEPVRTCYHSHCGSGWCYHCGYYGYPYTLTGGVILNNNYTFSGSDGTKGSTLGGVYTSNSIQNCGQNSMSFNSSDSYSVSNSVVPTSAAPSAANLHAPDARRSRQTKSLESLVAVGAGQHVDQKITYVQGLIKPTFSETIRVRYMWWDDLQSALRARNVPAPHPSGFPGDVRRGINLGSTPRVGENFSREAVEFAYTRF